MACHSCSMPSVEGFTQMPQTEYFSDKKGYECQTQANQTCVYTAQGDMVCSKDIKSNTNVAGTAFFDRMQGAPITENFYIRESRPPK